MIVARHYVSVQGALYTPGEIIPEGRLTAEKMQRLVAMKAIDGVDDLPDAPSAMPEKDDVAEAAEAETMPEIEIDLNEVVTNGAHGRGRKRK